LSNPVNISGTEKKSPKERERELNAGDGDIIGHRTERSNHKK